MRNDGPSGAAIFAGLILAVLVVAGIWFLSAMSWARTDGGHYAVVRNGGPLDNNRIRDVLQPGSSRKWEGVYSQVHKYPASQRYYTISADSGGDRAGVDVFRGSTSDGVQVGLEGSVTFTLDGDPNTLRAFDNKFGTRTFPIVGGGSAAAWDSDTGWNAFLDAVFRRQVLDNALRIEVQKFRCVELIPSCKYVQTGDKQVNGQVANENLAQVQNDIKAELQTDFDSTLGGHYINIGAFRISRVTLSPNVQNTIDAANAAKVEIKRQAFAAQQEVQKAIGDKRSKLQQAQGIRALNKAYAKSPAKARIDAIAQLPRGLNTLVFGSNGNLLLPTK